MCDNYNVFCVTYRIDQYILVAYYRYIFHCKLTDTKWQTHTSKQLILYQELLFCLFHYQYCAAILFCRSPGLACGDDCAATTSHRREGMFKHHNTWWRGRREGGEVFCRDPDRPSWGYCLSTAYHSHHFILQVMSVRTSQIQPFPTFTKASTAANVTICWHKTFLLFIVFCWVQSKCQTSTVIFTSRWLQLSLALRSNHGFWLPNLINRLDDSRIFHSLVSRP